MGKKHYEIDLIVIVNEEARKRGIGYETHDPVTVTHELKSAALQQSLAKYRWDALVTGIRRDEDSTRAKERYFSPRTADNEWEYRDQPPEFWGQFTTAVKPGEACSSSAFAGLDGVRHLGVCATGRDSDPKNVFCSKWPPVPIFRVLAYYKIDRKLGRYLRGHCGGVESHQDFGKSGSGPGSSRT